MASDSSQEHRSVQQMSFKEGMEFMYKRSNDQEAITPTLEAAKTALPQLAESKSCTMIGCGSADMELMVLRNYLPNVRRLIAVEPETESVEALKRRLLECPQYQTSIYQETMQVWRGPRDLVDVVLLFNCLNHIPESDRLPVVQKLFDVALSDGGLVMVLLFFCCGDFPQNDFCKIFSALGNKFTHVLEADLLHEMTTAGFQMVYRGHFQSTFNVENRDDAFLSMFQHVPGDHPNPVEGTKPVSLERTRAIVDEVFGEASLSVFDNLLLIFQKP